MTKAAAVRPTVLALALAACVSQGEIVTPAHEGGAGGSGGGGSSGTGQAGRSEDEGGRGGGPDARPSGSGGGGGGGSGAPRDAAPKEDARIVRPVVPALAARYARLARGIAIVNWAQRYFGQNNVTNLGYVSSTELDQLKRWGLTAIRLPIDPTVVIDAQNPSQPRNVAALDAILKKLVDAGFAVTVDLHDSDGALAYKTDQAARSRLTSFWTAFASHLATTTDPERVFLELVNEPNWKDAAGWWSFQQTLLAAVRGVAPKHTVVCGADGYDPWSTLVAMKPYADDNVVYKVHYYAPGPFTCQGCAWWPPMQDLRNVPYPSDPTVVAQASVLNGNGAAMDELRKYGAERWNQTRIRQDLTKLRVWADDNGVPVVINEFGVLKDFAPRDGRVAWFGDMRAAMGATGFGWSLWAYEGGGFSLLEDSAMGPRNPPDAAVLQALGLTM